MKNSIADLNNILFKQLERLTDDTGELDLEKEMKKAKVVCDVSEKILEVGSLQLRAMEMASEYQIKNSEMPDVLRMKHSGAKALEGALNG